MKILIPAGFLNTCTFLFETSLNNEGVVSG